MGYKKVSGTIVYAHSALGDVRLNIDITKHALKSVFTGDIELERLKHHRVILYIPKIKNKKKVEKK